MKRKLASCLVVLAAWGGNFNPTEAAAGDGLIINPIPVRFACTGQAVSPDLVTDGQRVYLSGSVSSGMSVFLNGYRYNDAPPTSSDPDGTGKEAIYCGCAPVLFLASSDPEFSPAPYFVLPTGAPSGDYSVQLVPTGSCPASGTGDVCAAYGTCPTMQVQPSYVVSVSDRLAFNGNSENDGDSTSELAFGFASQSGAAFGSGDFLVEWSGSFPGGADGSAHLTNADLSSLSAKVPLFVGRESMMTYSECSEECPALPSTSVSDCQMACSDNNTLGRFNSQLQFALTGVEYDDSPSKAWGWLAGLAAGGLTCFGASEVGLTVPGCGAAGLGLIDNVANFVNDALADADDNLGAVSQTAGGGPLGADWNIGSLIGPYKMGGTTKNNGDIDLYYRNRRFAGPRILGYKVVVKSLTLEEGYDCNANNEVYLHARATLNRGESEMQGTVRFPDSGNWSLSVGSTKTFSPALVIDQRTFAPESAPESPFIYVELGAWEDDDSNDDALGIHADTISLGSLMGTTGGAIESTTPEGYFTRTKTLSRTVIVNGWQDNDNDNCSYGWPPFVFDPKAKKGRLRIGYDVEVTWLKQTRR